MKRANENDNLDSGDFSLETVPAKGLKIRYDQRNKYSCMLDPEARDPAIAAFEEFYRQNKASWLGSSSNNNILLFPRFEDNE